MQDQDLEDVDKMPEPRIVKQVIIPKQGTPVSITNKGIEAAHMRDEAIINALIQLAPMKDPARYKETNANDILAKLENYKDDVAFKKKVPQIQRIYPDLIEVIKWLYGSSDGKKALKQGLDQNTLTWFVHRFYEGKGQETAFKHLIDKLNALKKDAAKQRNTAEKLLNGPVTGAKHLTRIGIERPEKKSLLDIDNHIQENPDRIPKELKDYTQNIDILAKLAVGIVRMLSEAIKRADDAIAAAKKKPADYANILLQEVNAIEQLIFKGTQGKDTAESEMVRNLVKVYDKIIRNVEALEKVTALPSAIAATGKTRVLVEQAKIKGFFRPLEDYAYEFDIDRMLPNQVVVTVGQSFENDIIFEDSGLQPKHFELVKQGADTTIKATGGPVYIIRDKHSIEIAPGKSERLQEHDAIKFVQGPAFWFELRAAKREEAAASTEKTA